VFISQTVLSQLTVRAVEYAHLDYREKQTRTLRISERNLYKGCRHALRHMDPTVKIAPGPDTLSSALPDPTFLSIITLAPEATKNI